MDAAFKLWDTLTRQGKDGALVRLITPVYPNEDMTQAEARLTAFTQVQNWPRNEYKPILDKSSARSRRRGHNI